MPLQKSKKPAVTVARSAKAKTAPAAKTAAKPVGKAQAVEKAKKTAISTKAQVSKIPPKSAAKPDLPPKKVPPVPSKSSQAKLTEAADALLAAALPAKKKPGRPPKNPAAAQPTCSKPHDLAAASSRGEVLPPGARNKGSGFLPVISCKR